MLRRLFLLTLITVIQAPLFAQELSESETLSGLNTGVTQHVHEIDLATLDDILQNIPGARPDPASWEEYLQAWWNRFISRLSPDLEIDDGPPSLNRKIANQIFAAIAVVVAVIAVMLITVEIHRKRGSFSRKKLVPAKDFANVVEVQELLTLDQIDQVAFRDRPAFLLRLIVLKLSERSPNVWRDSLTHRDIASASTTLDQQKGNILQKIASTAERIRYGGRQPSAEQVHDIEIDARNILLDPGK